MLNSLCVLHCISTGLWCSRESPLNAGYAPILINSLNLKVHLNLLEVTMILMTATATIKIVS